MSCAGQGSQCPSSYGLYREVGIGYKGLVTFCKMNIPEPMNYSAYENINSKLYVAYSEVAGESMLKAADEIIRNRLFVTTSVM